jgi:dsRNA-specific ribonuclease
MTPYSMIVGGVEWGKGSGASLGAAKEEAARNVLKALGLVEDS